jgi:hypothetical protein
MSKAKKQAKAISPPSEIWLVWFHNPQSWMGGSNDDETACFLTEERARSAAEEIVRSCGGEFTVVQVLPRKRAKGGGE